MIKFETLNDLKLFIDHIEKNRPRELNNTVEISIVSQGSIGGMPTVKIRDMVCGIDWDNGKFIIYTDEPVIKLTPDELKDVRKSISQAYSYHTSLVVRPLMQENKEMKEFILNLDPSLLNDEQKAYVDSLKKNKKKT